MLVSHETHRKFSDAIGCGDAAVVRALIQQHATLVNHPDWTPPPLHCCVLWNQVEIAKILLANGADLEALDPDRQTTPLRYAILFAKPEMARLFISLGARRTPITPGGMSAQELAQAAAAGEYEQYSDMPRRTEYSEILTLLEEETD